MNVNKNYVWIGLGGIVVGAVIAGLVFAIGIVGYYHHSHEMMGGFSRGGEMKSKMITDRGMKMNMMYMGDSTTSGMAQGVQAATGDAFDTQFLSDMIVHHQGAISMATSALKNAKHQEIKDLAKNIIAAQNKEITEMQAWQLQWYPPTK